MNSNSTTTATHTPGPWKVYHPISTAESLGIDAASGESVVVWGERHEGIIGERREANARLIAAAPELLEALRFCIPALEWSVANSPSAVRRSSARSDLEIARAAIAKATGETK